MTSSSVISARAKWIELVEAVHAPAPDDAAWAEPIVVAARTIFPRAAMVGLYVLEHPPDLSSIRARLSFPSASQGLLDRSQTLADLGGFAAFGPFHFGAPVLTVREALQSVAPEVRESVQSLRRSAGFADGLGIVTHPAPGLITVLHAIFERPVTIAPHERRLLTRIALHLESGHRVRLRPSCVKAELTAQGRVIHREPDAPAAHLLEAQCARVREARTRGRRTSGEALELWSALVGGRVSLAPSRDGGSYLVLDNPLATHALRALSSSEIAVLSLASRGVSTKLIAYGLGVAPSSVSERLSSAAWKIGTVSRAELVRIAAVLAGDPRAELDAEALTSAERDVLELLQRGLSNSQIATHRSRSIRTIANQVSALLRKTKSPSRRALVTSQPAHGGPAVSTR